MFMWGRGYNSHPLQIKTGTHPRYLKDDGNEGYPHVGIPLGIGKIAKGQSHSQVGLSLKKSL